MEWLDWRGGSRRCRPTVIASVAKQSISPPKGRMDCFASLAMTDDTPSRSRGSICPRFAGNFHPPVRGRRECRVHAAPAVSCAIGRQKRTRAYRAAEASDIPCAMALRLISCSPRSGRARCHRRRRNTALDPIGSMRFHQLDASIGASGPHDFAVRFRHARLSQHPRPPHPIPRL